MTYKQVFAEQKRASSVKCKLNVKFSISYLSPLESVTTVNGEAPPPALDEEVVGMRLVCPNCTDLHRDANCSEQELS